MTNVRIPRKLDTRSAANWTAVPRQTGHLGRDVTARGRGCSFTPDGSGLSNRPVFFSSLIERDIDLLSDMAAKRLVSAAITITTLDSDIACTLEATSNNQFLTE